MKTTNIINLTPHSLNLGNNCIPPSGKVARVAVKRELSYAINGISVYIPKFGNLEMIGNGDDITFPPQIGGTIYVVSAMVKVHPDLKSRVGVDIFSPGSPIRDEKGVIIGADGLDG